MAKFELTRLNNYLNQGNNGVQNLLEHGIELPEDAHPSSHTQLTWITPPKVCFIVGKRDDLVYAKIGEVANWIETLDITVVVEKHTIEKNKERSAKWLDIAEVELSKIDFGVCIGGDGTMIHYNSFFPSSCPPAICFFYRGSLGFLMKFEIDQYQEEIMKVVKGPFILTLRSRIRVTHRSCSAIQGGRDIEENESLNQRNEWGDDYNAYTCVNEAVMDRGPSAFLSSIDCHLDGKLITTVQGDGLIVATSTGSTAYSLSAGGSMLHPCVPAMIFTPICPHSLSFRPVILPSVSKLTITTTPESRGTAWVCCDGRGRYEIKKGDEVKIKMSRFPLPTVCQSSAMSEWFSTLANCLNWNIRTKQNQL